MGITYSDYRCVPPGLSVSAISVYCSKSAICQFQARFELQITNSNSTKIHKIVLFPIFLVNSSLMGFFSLFVQRCHGFCDCGSWGNAFGAHQVTIPIHFTRPPAVRYVCSFEY